MTDSVTIEPCGCVVDREGFTQGFCQEHDILADYRREFQRGMRMLTAPRLAQNGRTA